jgi:hypothetical protein
LTIYNRLLIKKGVINADNLLSRYVNSTLPSPEIYALLLVGGDGPACPVSFDGPEPRENRAPVDAGDLGQRARP